MDILPLEIWIKVAEMVGPCNWPAGIEPSEQWWEPFDTRPDVSNMRLACRLFHAAATPILFQTIEINKRRRIPQPSTWDDREQIARYRPQPKPSYWLSKVLWLKNSVIIRHCHTLTLNIPGDDGGAPVEEVVEAQAVLDELPSLVQGCVNLRTLRLLLRLGPSSYLTLVKIGDVLEARIGPSPKLKIACSTEIDSEHWENSLYNVVTDVGRDRIVRFLGRIRDLDFDSGLRYKDKQDAQRFASNLCSLIAVAVKLESLRLSLEDGEIDQELRTLSSEGPQNLQSLSLWSMRISEASLLGLVRRNASTLKTLEIKAIALESGTWRSTLLSLCSIRFPNFSSRSLKYVRGAVPFDVDSYYHITETILEPLGVERCLNEISKTNDINDFCALGHLQRHVNRVRCQRGLILYDEKTFQLARLPPIDGVEG